MTESWQGSEFQKNKTKALWMNTSVNKSIAELLGKEPMKKAKYKITSYYSQLDCKYRINMGNRMKHLKYCAQKSKFQDSYREYIEP